MATVNIEAIFEGLTRQGPEQEFDAKVVGSFPESLTVQIEGSQTFKRGVLIPSHISYREIGYGETVRLGLYRGELVLLERFDQIDPDPAYAGLGFVPDPPAIQVSVDCDAGEWNVSWTTRQDQVESFELYWATDSDGSGSDLVIDTEDRSAVVPLDGVNDPPKIYFAVRAVAGSEQSNLSPWTTDSGYVNSLPLVSFGDDENHGHVTPNGVRYKVYDGQVIKSDDDGASWDDVTPGDPSDDFIQAETPTAAATSFIQVFGDDDVIYILATFEDSGGVNGGWLVSSDDQAETWTYTPLASSPSGVDLLPIWGDYNGTYILITVNEDGGLQLQELDLTLTISNTYTLGAATKTETNNKTYVVYPVVVSDDDSVWHLFGRMPELPDTTAGPYHILKTDDDGATWLVLVGSGETEDWTTDYCAALRIKALGSSSYRYRAQRQ